ncbi:PKD-like domain-containing protein, partial [Belliella aquatica]
MINTVFPDKVITSLSENGHLKQYESFKIEADNSLDLSSVSINIISFNSNLTYFPGGSISVLFEPKGILPLDNVFQLEMSDANGSFASPEVIAIANEFFTPILNGKIPTSIVPGTGYKLRISYGSEVGPRLNYELPNAFGISSNNTPFPTPYVNVSETADGVDFRCLENPNTTTNPNYHFGSVEQGSSAVLLNDLNMSDPVSSWGPNTTARLYSLNSGSWSSSNLPITGLGTRSIKIPSGTPIGYYLIEFTKTISGQSSTYSYLFNFNTGNSGISNLDNDNICVDASVSFEIAKQSMRNNYPGSKYTINWGDGSPEEVYTHSELMESESLSHVFKSSTCSSEESDLRLGKYYFEVGFLLFNKGSSKNTICDDYSQNGNGAFKLVNTSVAPTAVVDAPEYICEGDNLTATDISIRGQYGDGNVCLTEYIREWLITPPGGAEELVDLSVDDDGNYIFPVYASWVDENGNLNLPGDIVSPGCWSIKLRIKNPSTAGCKISTEAITPVNVQAIPVPAFAIDKGPEICKDETIAFTDNSNVLDFLCQNPTYEWIVTPVAPPAIESGFEFTEGTDSSSPDPKIKFTQPGAYNVVLKITNACGPVSSAPQRIDVLGAPKVIFDNDELLVCRTSPEFNLDFSDGVINPTFGEFPFAPETYKWEVFKDDEITPADMDSYEFVVPSIDEDQLPIIKFKKYGIYKIKITVTTKCNDSSFDFFRFELREEPVITNEDINQNICSGETTKEIVFTSSMPDPGTTFRWIVAPVDGLSGYVPTGTGPKIEPRLLQNTTNLPLELIYKVVASNNGCDSEEKQFTITVNPTPVISNKAPEPICSGDAFTVNPEDGVSGDIVPLNTNYTWTMSPSDIGLVGVLSGSDVTIISEVLTNNTNTVQKATYTVTPKSGACEGDPFVIEVTVNPVPVVEAAPNSDVICSDGTTYITLSPKSTGTTAMTFSWTASVTTSPAGIGADITGFSTQSATGIQSVIEDKLINTGTSPGVVTYEITPYFGDCAGTTISVPVTVNPAGQVDQEDDQVICQGEDTQAINFSTINTIGITTYAWEIDKNIGLFPLSGIGNIPAFKGVNASSESIVATVTVRPTFTH